MSKQSRWEVDEERCPMCATRTQRVMWICLFFWLLMVPVIVIPIVLTTRTVSMKIGSAVLACQPRPGTLNGTCAAQSDGAQDALGTPMNITFTVSNPNYRPGTTSFNIKVNGSQYTITPHGGWPVPGTTIAAKGDTNITVTVNVAYYLVTEIDPFFTAQVWNAAGTGSTQPFNILIYGSMLTSIGSVSTQNLNFAYNYTLPAGS